MSSRFKKPDASEVLILRTRRCRKSDAVIRFLEKENIPHRVLPLEEDFQAQELARQWNIKSSPGILVGNQTINVTEILKNCQIQNPEKTKQMFLSMLDSSKIQ